MLSLNEKLSAAQLLRLHCLYFICERKFYARKNYATLEINLKCGRSLSAHVLFKHGEKYYIIPAYHCCGLRTPRRRQGTTQSVFQGDRTQISREAGGDLSREIWRTLLHSLLTTNEGPFNAGVV